MPELIDFTIKILLIVIGSIVTIHFSLSRFYTEKWWEKKADAYTEIMELLYNYQLYVEKEIYDIQSNQKIEQDIDENVWTKKDINHAHRKIEKIITIGTFVVSEEIIGVIKELMSELHKAKDEETYLEYLFSKDAALHKAIGKYRDYAKQDLKINKYWPYWYRTFISNMHRGSSFTKKLFINYFAILKYRFHHLISVFIPYCK